ncbi:HNH endonuclease family protein [Metapseudomonas otitidis]|uniref:hypothetical protein n=1 Tax=Metapseudomonas otitidis TaxID=319939 RepID=UPI0013F68684|nr:hypothetical protein [Pseudomonas otitidis]
MNCPDPLPLDHAKILRYKNHKVRISAFLSSDMEWKDNSLKPTRDAIRKSLRTTQEQSCFYCRRMIATERRNMGEAIEHFLDKSKPHYRKWAFHPLNLVIACQPCNFVKSTKDLGNIDVQKAEFLQPHIGEFKWPHPYFDSYSENIKISPGPVYSPIPGAPRHKQASTMIKDLELNSLANIDDRVQFTARKIQELQKRVFRTALRQRKFGSEDRYKLYLKELEHRIDRGLLEIFGI